MTRQGMKPGRTFWRDTRGAAALEFAIVATPFILVLLCTLQIGLYYYTQSALDSGVLETAQSLYTGFRTGTTPNLPGAAALKSSVASYTGGLIGNNASLAVEIQPLANLSSATVPVSDGVNNYGTTGSTLMLRAQATVMTFVPMFSVLTVANSSAIVRRQGV